MMQDGLYADGSGEMRLAGAVSAHQHHVVGILQELAAVQ